MLGPQKFKAEHFHPEISPLSSTECFENINSACILSQNNSESRSFISMDQYDQVSANSSTTNPSISNLQPQGMFTEDFRYSTYHLNHGRGSQGVLTSSLWHGEHKTSQPLLISAQQINQCFEQPGKPLDFLLVHYETQGN